jgi:hypothetical protein
VGVSAWRIASTVQSTKTVDWSYILIDIALQSHLEIWLGIISANLPMMSPLLTKILMPAVSGFLKSLSSRGYGSSGGAKQSHDESNISASRRKRFRQLEEGTESMESPLAAIDTGIGRHANFRDDDRRPLAPTNLIRKDVEIQVHHSPRHGEQDLPYTNF